MMVSPAKQYEEYAISMPVTTLDREIELSKVIMGDPGEERDLAIVELINGNMRLVLDRTRKYKSMPDYIDTLFDAHLGLVKAAPGFDARKGKFSTWATFSMRTEIRNGIMARTGAARISTDISAIAFKIKGMSGDFSEKDAVSSRLGMMAIMDAVPLVNSSGELLDIVDPKSGAIFDDIQKNDLMELIRKAADELGLNENDLSIVSISDSTYLANKMGMTGSNIRMLRTKLIWKIRRKILGYVGKDEYLFLSNIGKIPSVNWR